MSTIPYLKTAFFYKIIHLFFSELRFGRYDVRSVIHRKIQLIILFSVIQVNIYASNTPDKRQANTHSFTLKTGSDTLWYTINNKKVFTLLTNNQFDVNNGKVKFTNMQGKDTLFNYLTDKQVIIDRMKKGDTIRNSIIMDSTLGFYNFTDSKDSSVCSYPVVFVNCIFYKLIGNVPEQIIEGDLSQNSIEFTKSVMLLNCDFLKGFEIFNCVFDTNFFLTGHLTSPYSSEIEFCTFGDITYFMSKSVKENKPAWFNIKSCTFDSLCLCMFNCTENGHVEFRRCNFEDAFSVGKSLPQSTMEDFRRASILRDPKGVHFLHRTSYYVQFYSDFIQHKYDKEYYFNPTGSNEKEFDKLDTLEEFVPKNRPIYNLAIINSTITNNLDLANANLINCTLEDLVILKSIDITSTKFSYTTDYKGKQALEDLSFPNSNGIIYADFKTFFPADLKLNTYLEKTEIHPLVHNFADPNFLSDNSNYYNRIRDYSAKQFTDNSLVLLLQAKYQHEKCEWEQKYYGAHIRHADGVSDFFSSSIHWLTGAFLEITLNNGYKGELRFCFWVLFLIILFSILYYFRHGEAVIDYLNSMYNKDEAAIANYPTMKVYKSLNRFRDYLRCIWFSIMVFFDPRLPITFFNLRVGLFGMVFIEWLCGFTAILLFLIFLASNYPFLHSLIGI